MFVVWLCVFLNRNVCPWRRHSPVQSSVTGKCGETTRQPPSFSGPCVSKAGMYRPQGDNIRFSGCLAWNKLCRTTFFLHPAYSHSPECWPGSRIIFSASPKHSQVTLSCRKMYGDCVCGGNVQEVVGRCMGSRIPRF